MLQFFLFLKWPFGCIFYTSKNLRCGYIHTYCIIRSINSAYLKSNDGKITNIEYYLYKEIYEMACSLQVVAPTTAEDNDFDAHSAAPPNSPSEQFAPPPITPLDVPTEGSIVVKNNFFVFF